MPPVFIDQNIPSPFPAQHPDFPWGVPPPWSPWFGQGLSLLAPELVLTVVISWGYLYDTTDWCLKQQKLIFLQFRGLEVHYQGPAGSSIWRGLSSWPMDGRLLSAFTRPFLGVCSRSDLSSFSYKDTSPVGLRLILTTSFNLNSLLQALFPNTVTLGVGLATYKF